MGLASEERPFFKNGFETFEPTTVFVGETINYDLQILAEGDDPGAFDYTVAPLPLAANASLAGTQFSFTPAADQLGTFEFELSARAPGEEERSGIARVTVVPPPADAPTVIRGRLLDATAMAANQEVPVVSARVSLFGAEVGDCASQPCETFTDAQGQFVLDGLQTGSIVLDIDTSTALDAPDGSSYSAFREPFDIAPNIQNVIERPIFLPRIDPDSITPIDPFGDTVVRNPNNGIEIDVPAGAADNPDGSNFSGEMSISDVPVEFAPMQMPRELQPEMLVTIQPTGIRFDQPVPIVFPNTDDLAPGSETDIWSLDPDTGQFIVVGSGRVSTDGSLIETFEGGVRTASWHMTLPRPPIGSSRTTNAAGDDNPEVSVAGTGDICVGSRASLSSGCLSIRHELPGYRTFGTEQGLSLEYRSETAYPNPLITVATALPSNAALPNAFAAELTVVGGIRQNFQVFTEAVANDTVRQTATFNASNFPTGSYPYQVMVDSIYSGSTVGTRITGRLLIDNQIQSPAGTGWRIQGISRLVNTSGGVLLRTSAGNLRQFSIAESSLFPSPARFTVGNAPRDITRADLDGDGVIDLATANEFSDDVSVLVGNGDGTFQPAQSFESGNGPWALTPADLDNDGLLDLVTANINSDNVSVLMADGNGSFTNVQNLPAGNGPSSITTGDLNRDGVLDLAVANQFSDDVSVLFGNGDGTFQTPSNFEAGNEPLSITTSDLNRDGISDLVTANFSSDDVSVLLGNGDGSFQSELSFAAGNGTAAVTIVDLNGDGARDLATANFFSDNISVLLGNGDGLFQPAEIFDAGTEPRSISSEDLNGDGTLDLIAANSSSDDVTVILGNGDGTFGNSLTFPLGERPRAVIIDDLDNDGRLDLAAANQDSDDVSLLLGNGDGSFQTALSLQTGDSPRSVEAADLDGDGFLDLATANTNSNDVTVILGDGDGAFSSPQSFAAGNTPRFIEAADLNGDGLLDLSVTNENSDDVSVLVGTGGGSFANAVSFPAGNAPWGLAVADFNSDGILDLAATSILSDSVSLLFGNGDGSFGSAANLVSGDAPLGVVAADLNGDGVADLATANADSDDVTVLLGTGGGSFQAPSSFDAGDRPFSIAAADVNADGVVDLVTANPSSNDVSVLLGSGDGSFQPELTFSAGEQPLSITINDLDGDGTLDIATTNASTSNVTVLLGEGDGSFQSGLSFDVGNEPADVIAADLNADGTSDLSIANFASNSLSVLLGSSGDIEYISPPGDFTVMRRQDDGRLVRFFKDGTQSHFNADGMQMKRVSPNGRVTTFGYDSRNRLNRVSDPAGQETALRYSSDTISEIVGPAGRVTRFVHDTAGNLIEIINPDGTSRSFEYNQNALMTSQSDERGNRTEYIYDSTGRFVSSVLPDGTTRSMAVSSTAALADDPGSTSADNPAPAVLDDSVQSAFVDGDGNLVSFRTDRLGNIVERTDPLLRTTILKRDTDGLPTRIERPNGSVQTRRYDRKGNLLELFEQSIAAATLISYEPEFNQPVTIIDPLGNSTRFEYDDQGNLITAVDVDGVVDTIQYGEPACPGLPTEITVGAGTPSAATSTIAYDPDSCNPTIATDPLGRQVTREYDAAGNLVRLVDAEGRVHRWAYDVMNRVEKIIDASNSDPSPQCGTTGVTCIDYDAAGNVIQVTDPRGGQIGFVYDERNRVVSRTDANGAIAQFEYDAEGNLIRAIDRKGQEITFDYDAADRLVEKTWLPGMPGEETITLEYDVIDNLTSAADADSVLTRTHDPIGRLLTESTNGSPSQPNVTLSYSYDEAGNRTQLSGPGFTSDYAYDETNRLISLSAPSGGLFEFTYDALGRRIGITRPNNVTTTAVFDAASQLVNLAHQRQGDAEPFTELTYGYDGVGNVTSLDQSRPILDLQPTLGFGYDSEEQLVQATNPFIGNPDETFQYDPAGNRLLRDGESFSAIHDDANRLLENEDFCFSYDLNGNLLTKQQKIGGACSGATTEYTYNPENQLVQVAIDGNVIADYRYDALGRRIQKETTMGTQKYVYDGADIVLEYNGSDTLKAHYLHSLNIDEPLLMRRDQDDDGVFEPSEDFYYTADRLGSILELTREDGTVAQSYAYQGFGRTTVLDGGGLEIEPLAGIRNPYAYTAREFEMHTGLYYYRARFYSSSKGRFIQADPIGLRSGETNGYTYVSNSPINFTDPFGLLKTSRVVPVDFQGPLSAGCIRREATSAVDLVICDIPGQVDEFREFRGVSVNPAQSAVLSSINSACESSCFSSFAQSCAIGTAQSFPIRASASLSGSAILKQIAKRIPFVSNISTSLSAFSLAECLRRCPRDLPNQSRGFVGAR